MALTDSIRELQNILKEKYTKSDKPMQLQDIRDPKSNIEYEVRFGINKPFTKMEFERIYSKLISHGFVKVREEHQLKIITDSSIRCEINDLSKIKEYCKSNILPVGSQYITKRSLVSDPKRYINMNFNFRISIQNEYNYGEKDPEIVELYEKWEGMEKSFRYMNRIKLEHPDQKGICVDMSIVKSSKKRGELIKEHDFSKSKLFTEPEIYEIEVEINDIKHARSRLRDMDTYLKNTIKYISSGHQSSNFPIPLIEQHSALFEYHTLLGKRAKNLEAFVQSIDSSMFIGPSSFTLQKMNLVDDPTNTSPCILQDFCVSEKADGIRKLLYISNKGRIYFITMNMMVQYTGSICNNKVFHGSILDGEHVIKDKHGTTINLYAAFDLYYLGKDDKRKMPFITEKGECRYGLLRRMLNDITYTNETEIGMCNITYKKFYPVTRTETIFDCCKTLFERMHLFDYETDGIIFTSTKLGVGMEKEGDEVKNYLYSWKHSFKWKPAEFNTIDFVVKTKKIGIQDVVENYEKGSDIASYKILMLYVGYNPRRHGQINSQQTLFNGAKAISDDTYMPVLFTPTNPPDPFAHIAYVELKSDSSGEMKMFTEDNQVIESETVVECKYVHKDDKRFSWVPLRIRYEKTEDYKKGKSFGNAYHVANSNWQTIHNPITQDMLCDKPLTLDDIGDTGVYYNKDGRASKTKNLRDFHNIDIKKMLLETVSGEGKTLVDFACGKGGDIHKWVNNYKFVLGIDISPDNIHNPIDGACARYLNLKKERNKIFDALFIQGDSSKLYLTEEFSNEEVSKNVLNQVMGVGKANPQYGAYVAKLFNIAPQFDVGSIQFAIHYMFKDLRTLHNFAKNVSDLISLNGYFTGTCYDGNLIHVLLNETEIGESKEIYIEDRKVWAVTKEYNQENFSKESCLGYTISVYQESINNVIDEYLVNFDYLIEVMGAYGFILSSPNKEIPPLGSFEREYKNSRFKMTQEEQMISFLNKYFIFKKVRNVNTSQVHRSYTEGAEEPFSIGVPEKLGRKIVLRK